LVQGGEEKGPKLSLAQTEKHVRDQNQTGDSPIGEKDLEGKLRSYEENTVLSKVRREKRTSVLEIVVKGGKPPLSWVLEESSKKTKA